LQALVPLEILGCAQDCGIGAGSDEEVKIIRRQLDRFALLDLAGEAALKISDRAHRRPPQQ